MGYYAKLNTNSKPMKEKTSYAVLYVFRPRRSDFGEPELAVKEMKDGKMIEDAPPLKFVTAMQIVAIGGLTNLLCDAAEAWLKANMGAYFDGIRTTGNIAAGAADVGRALEESLGILDKKQLHERYILHVRAYFGKVMNDHRGILGIRKGNIEWTKLEEGKDAEAMTNKVHKATTKYGKWSVRQMLRSVEIISALTEFAPVGAIANTVMLFQTMMADHEEEIHVHHKALDWNNADVTKACTLVANPLHGLDGNGHIANPVHVPHMIAYAIGELTTLATAEGGATAQLTDATA